MTITMFHPSLSQQAFHGRVLTGDTPLSHHHYPPMVHLAPPADCVELRGSHPRQTTPPRQKNHSNQLTTHLPTILTGDTPLAEELASISPHEQMHQALQTFFKLQNSQKSAVPIPPPPKKPADQGMEEKLFHSRETVDRLIKKLAAQDQHHPILVHDSPLRSAGQSPKALSEADRDELIFILEGVDHKSPPIEEEGMFPMDEVYY